MSQDYFDYIPEEDGKEDVRYFSQFRTRFRRMELKQETKVILDTTHLKPVFEDSTVAAYDLQTADFHVVHMPGGKSRGRGQLDVMLLNPRVRFLYDVEQPQLVAATDERWFNLFEPHVQHRQICYPLTDPDGRVYAPSPGYVKYFKTSTHIYLFGGEHSFVADGKRITRKTLIARMPHKGEKTMRIGNWALHVSGPMTATCEAARGECIGRSEDPETVYVAGMTSSGPIVKLTSEYGVELTKHNLALVRALEPALTSDSQVRVGGHVGCLISEVSGQTDEIDYVRVKIGNQTVLMTGLDHLDFAIPVDDAFGKSEADPLTQIGHGRPFVLVNKKTHIPGAPTKYLMSDMTKCNDEGSRHNHSWGVIQVAGLVGTQLGLADSLPAFQQKVKDGELKPSYPAAITTPPTLEIAMSRVMARNNDRQKAKKDGLAMFSAITASHAVS